MNQAHVNGPYPALFRQVGKGSVPGSRPEQHPSQDLAPSLAAWCQLNGRQFPLPFRPVSCLRCTPRTPSICSTSPRRPGPTSVRQLSWMSSRISHARAETELLRQMLPGDPGMQHEQNALEHQPIRMPLTPRMPSRPLRPGQQRLHHRPQLIINFPRLRPSHPTRPDQQSRSDPTTKIISLGVLRGAWAAALLMAQTSPNSVVPLGREVVQQVHRQYVAELGRHRNIVDRLPGLGESHEPARID